VSASALLAVPNCVIGLTMPMRTTPGFFGPNRALLVSTFPDPLEEAGDGEVAAEEAFMTGPSVLAVAPASAGAETTPFAFCSGSLPAVFAEPVLSFRSAQESIISNPLTPSKVESMKRRQESFGQEHTPGIPETQPRESSDP
jgi:hypothetical protein